MNHPIFRRFENILEPFSPGSTAPAFEWETDNGDLLLRPPGGDLETVWAYLGRRTLAANLQNPRRLRTNGNKVRGAFSARRLWRMWPLENSEVAFFRAEFGLLRFPDDRELVEWKTPRGGFKSALDAFNASGKVVARLFDSLESNRDSDVHAARSWREIHRDNWASLEFRRGSRGELEAVLRAVAHLFLEPSASAYWHWWVIADDEGRVGFLRSFSPMAFGNRSQTAPNPVRRAMQDHFDIRLENIAAEPTRWRGYDWMGDPSARRLPELGFDAPTMHELMESRLFLRDWLRGKMPDAEIEALFSTL